MKKSPIEQRYQAALAGSELDPAVIAYAKGELAKDILAYEKEVQEALRVERQRSVNLFKVVKTLDLDRAATRRNLQEITTQLCNYSFAKFGIIVALLFLVIFGGETIAKSARTVTHLGLSLEWLTFATIGLLAGWRIGRGPSRKAKPLDETNMFWHGLSSHEGKRVCRGTDKPASEFGEHQHWWCSDDDYTEHQKTTLDCYL